MIDIKDKITKNKIELIICEDKPSFKIEKDKWKIVIEKDKKGETIITLQDLIDGSEVCYLLGEEGYTHKL